MEDYIVAPTIPHTHTVIFLHDRHRRAMDCAALLLDGRFGFRRITMPQLFPFIKWVFPKAPDRYSERFDCDLSQWFDIWSTSSPYDMEEIQEEGLNESFEQILGIIDREAKLVDSYQHVILGGHGMGCAVGILALLQGLHKLGGFIGISGWLPFCNDLIPICSTISERKATALSNFKQYFYYSKCEDGDGSMIFDGWQTPIFLEHAANDKVVPIAIGDEMRQTLMRIFQTSDFPLMHIQFNSCPFKAWLFSEEWGFILVWRFIKDVTGIKQELREREDGEEWNNEEGNNEVGDSEVGNNEEGDNEEGDNEEGDNKNEGPEEEEKKDKEKKDEEKKDEEKKDEEKKDKNSKDEHNKNGENKDEDKKHD